LRFIIDRRHCEVSDVDRAVNGGVPDVNSSPACFPPILLGFMGSK